MRLIAIWGLVAVGIAWLGAFGVWLCHDCARGLALAFVWWLCGLVVQVWLWTSFSSGEDRARFGHLRKSSIAGGVMIISCIGPVLLVWYTCIAWSRARSDRS